MRRELTRFHGQEVKSTGDGFLACFDGPARAIRCARAIGEELGAIGLEVRAGLHAGECVQRGGDLAGVAVHIAARVARLASPGEALVTSTVRDLVAGSDIEFSDRGAHALQGVPGEWQLLAVTPCTSAGSRSLARQRQRLVPPAPAVNILALLRPKRARDRRQRWLPLADAKQAPRPSLPRVARPTST